LGGGVSGCLSDIILGRRGTVNGLIMIGEERLKAMITIRSRINDVTGRDGEIHRP
jgi:hypothetical protein